MAALSPLGLSALEKGISDGCCCAPFSSFCCRGGSLQMAPSAVSQAIFISALAQFCFSQRRLHSFWDLFCVSNVASSTRVNLVFRSKQI